jgi:nucleotide-binding universal stress UspA family protein
MRKEKLSKVLIALDYDPTAQKVAEFGFLIAKTMKAEVTLQHVIADPVYYSSTEYSPIMGFNGNELWPLVDDAENLKKAAQVYLDKSKHHLGDDNIHTLVTVGDFAESILKAAKELHADVIVMGSHSRKWLENIIMGSVAEKVLRHTTIPLIIIPTKRKTQ